MVTLCVAARDAVARCRTNNRHDEDGNRWPTLNLAGPEGAGYYPCPTCGDLAEALRTHDEEVFATVDVLAGALDELIGIVLDDHPESVGIAELDRFIAGQRVRVRRWREECNASQG